MRASSASERPSPPLLVGLPVYNGERFLQRALDSLLAQTLPDFELLISDNASTDRSAEIAQACAARDARVRLVRQPRNIGAPRNWNFVARAARTRYFKWATANDECAPTMLADCVQALEDDPGAVLAQGRTCLVDEDSGESRLYPADLALPEPTGLQRLRSLRERLQLNNGQTGVIRVAALRRTRLDRPYPGGDIALMAELAMLGRFIVLPQVLCDRRMGRATFSRALDDDALTRFYDPQSRRRRLLDDRLHLHLDLLRSIGTSDLPLRERLAGMASEAREVRWDVSRWLHERVAPLRRAAR